MIYYYTKSINPYVLLPIASLVHLVALDQREAPEGVTHGPAQRPGTVSTMNKWAISGCSPRSIKSASNALTTAAFSVAPKSRSGKFLSLMNRM